MIEMLLHRGLRRLGDLGEFTLRALAQHFERCQHVHVSANRTADVAFVEVCSLFLLELFLRHLHTAFGDLLLDLANLTNGVVAARGCC